MTSNVGLTTPRGSGTSGYIQRNLSTLKPRDRDHGFGAPYAPTSTSTSRSPLSSYDDSGPPRLRQPDQEILRHERAREIEVRVLEERDRLEEEMEMEEQQGKGKGKGNGEGKEGKGEGEVLDEEEIDRRCDILREQLTKDLEDELSGRGRRGGGSNGGRDRGGKDPGKGNGKGKGLKPHQVHELAEAKILESERLRRALGIGEGREGKVWDEKRDREKERDRNGGRETNGERDGGREREGDGYEKRDGRGR